MTAFQPISFPCHSRLFDKDLLYDSDQSQSVNVGVTRVFVVTRQHVKRWNAIYRSLVNCCAKRTKSVLSLMVRYVDSTHLLLSLRLACDLAEDDTFLPVFNRHFLIKPLLLACLRWFSCSTRNLLAGHTFLYSATHLVIKATFWWICDLMGKNLSFLTCIYKNISTVFVEPFLFY